MKNFKTGAIGVVLLLSYLLSPAQGQKIPLNEPDYNKPKLFSDLPEKIKLNVQAMEMLFTSGVNAKVSMHISNELVFEGTIMSKTESKDALLTTIVVSLISRPGAVFTLSRTINNLGIPRYAGRIFNRNNGDAFVVSVENETYFLEKKNLYDLLSE